MFNVEGVGAKTKDLEKQRDRLIDDIKKLEEQYKKGLIDENAYKEKRHEVERAIVEVMDRLAQMRFLAGEA